MTIHRDDIAALAAELGPRRLGTARERRAGHVVAKHLERAGVPTIALPVSVHRSSVLPYVVLFGAAIVAVALARVSAWAGFVLGAAAAILLALELLDIPVVSRLLTVSQSTNILGLIPARQARDDEHARRVILTAHLDSPVVGRLRTPPLAGRLRVIASALAAAVIVLPIALLAQALSASLIAWYIALAAAVILALGAGLLGEHDLRGTPGAGVNDNASGIGVLLAVARELMANRPHNVETWLVFPAGGEAAGVGLKAFLEENRFDPEHTYFIDVDAVGAAPLHVIEAEGRLRRREASPALRQAAENIARSLTEAPVKTATRLDPPLFQYPPLAHGYQSLTLVGSATDGKPAAGAHWNETPDRIDGRAIEAAYTLTLGIVRRLDAAEPLDQPASDGSRPAAGVAERPEREQAWEPRTTSQP